MSLIKLLLENIIIDNAWNKKYMYHYTHVDNIYDIMDDGLLKSKNINYGEGCEGVHMTLKEYPDDANLPAHLWGEYENSFTDDGEIFETVIARLTINITELDINKFKVDDDHKMLSKNDDIEDSLNKTSAICYNDNIDKKYIENVEYYIDYHKYENVTNLLK